MLTFKKNRPELEILAGLGIISKAEHLLENTHSLDWLLLYPDIAETFRLSDSHSRKAVRAPPTLRIFCSLTAPCYFFQCILNELARIYLYNTKVHGFVREIFFLSGSYGAVSILNSIAIFKHRPQHEASKNIFLR